MYNVDVAIVRPEEITACFNTPRESLLRAAKEPLSFGCKTQLRLLMLPRLQLTPLIQVSNAEIVVGLRKVARCTATGDYLLRHFPRIAKAAGFEVQVRQGIVQIQALFGNGLNAVLCGLQCAIVVTLRKIG